MKKSEAKRIIKEELESYRDDNFKEIASWPIADVSYEDVMGVVSRGTMPKLPIQEGMSRYIYDEEQFRIWKSEFIRYYGAVGDLKFGSIDSGSRWTVFEIANNKKWDENARATRKAISRYYDEKESGGYTGD